MAKITKVNHIAIAVPDIERSLAFWQDILGVKCEKIEEVPTQRSKVAFLKAGEDEIELVEPTSEETGLARFLQEKGPGLHHLCLEVDDIEGMLADLKSKGVRLINETPQVLPDRKMAFIHPKSTGGVLVELYEKIK